MWNWKLSFVREERIERKERERGGGRVSISSRWSYWPMGARARTSIHTWIHGNGPSWSMLVMVNYHVSRTPTSPSSLCSFDSLSQICTVKLFWLLHSDLQSPCPISLSLPLFLFLPSIPESFIFRPDSFARALLYDFVIALIARFFIDGRGRSSQFLLIFYFFPRRVAKRETHGIFVEIGILFIQNAPWEVRDRTNLTNAE